MLGTGNDVTLVRNAQGSTPGGTLYTVFKDVNGNVEKVQIKFDHKPELLEAIKTTADPTLVRQKVLA